MWRHNGYMVFQTLWLREVEKLVGWYLRKPTPGQSPLCDRSDSTIGISISRQGASIQGFFRTCGSVLHCDSLLFHSYSFPLFSLPTVHWSIKRQESFGGAPQQWDESPSPPFQPPVHTSLHCISLIPAHAVLRGKSGLLGSKCSFLLCTVRSKWIKIWLLLSVWLVGLN